MYFLLLFVRNAESLLEARMLRGEQPSSKVKESTINNMMVIGGSRSKKSYYDPLPTEKTAGAPSLQSIQSLIGNKFSYLNIQVYMWNIKRLTCKERKICRMREVTWMPRPSRTL